MDSIRLADDTLFALDPPRVMGILNVTPDSFSDGGRFLAVDAAVARGRQLAAEGADILDVGGESTRPGADPVPPAAQIDRVVPVIAALSQSVSVPISIDTTHAVVAGAAIDAGASVVNDVTAGRADPSLLPLVAELRCPVVLMHMRGTPRTMQDDVHYGDVVRDVAAFLTARVDAARAAGIAADRIVVDPGIGFGKSVAQNLRLVRDLGPLRATGCPVLLGPSRKSFLGALTGRAVDERITATAAAVTAGILAGATIIRVHDVAAMVDVVRVATALLNSGRDHASGGPGDQGPVRARDRRSQGSDA